MHVDLGVILYIWLSADHVEWEVVCEFRLYACRTRTWRSTRVACGLRVNHSVRGELALYIWSSANHVEGDVICGFGLRMSHVDLEVYACRMRT